MDQGYCHRSGHKILEDMGPLACKITCYKSKCTATFRMDNQQGPPIEHWELCSMLCGSLGGRGVWGRIDTRVYMAESLPCSPETTTPLLISYTSV